MKLKYMYQLLISHIGVLVIAFLILSFSFAKYVENYVYQNKVEELIAYGQNILHDYSRDNWGGNRILDQYRQVLRTRNIMFSVFNQQGEIFYPEAGFFPRFTMSEKEWESLEDGKIVVVKQDLKRFDQAVSFVSLPFIVNGELMGGVLLVSPISGSRETISDINQFLFYTILISLTVSFLLSGLLSKLHVRRIQRIREATSMVSSGNYDVQVNASKIDEIGELASDFNEMVKKLKASQEEISRLEKRRRQFIADVSHELKTPLTTISGVIEGLKSDMIPEEEKERGIQLVSQEAKRLIRLVNENLDYEKIRSNQVKLNIEPIQLIDVFEIVKEQLLSQAEEKNNIMIIEADKNEIIYADYDRLIQILINIVKNSIQFTQNGKIFLRGKPGYKETIIEIEDTGIGMDEKEIENIWQRFYKADLSRTNNKYGEFGLGLSIVKQLVLLHQGEINVTSKKGKGTKFEIKLPVKS
ncbi:MAG: sensor histidine kinase [Bacillaceae bacterium]|nr:MAG: sensor histidine kinase [Bacillaceae bacterium]